MSKKIFLVKFIVLQFFFCIHKTAAVNAYITDFVPDTVSVVDTATNMTTHLISVGISPTGVAVTPNGQFVYVSCLGPPSAIYKIRTSDYTTDIIMDPILSNPYGLAITPNGQQVWVVNSSSGVVAVISTATDTVVNSVGVGIFPFRIAITPNGATAYVTNTSSNTVSAINTSSLAVTTISTGIGASPDGVAITPNGNFVYVTNVNNSPGTVSVIATATNTVAHVITLPFGTAPASVAITPDGLFAYVTDFITPYRLFVIDTSSNTIAQTILSPSFNAPSDVAITPDGLFAYVTNNGDASISVVQTTVPRGVVDSILGAQTPYEIAMAPLTPTILPPANLRGFQEVNDFGLVYEYCNTLHWEANPASSSVAGYNVYRNGKKIASLEPSQFKYHDHDRKKNRQYLYSVTSIDSAGNESVPINVEIK